MKLEQLKKQLPYKWRVQSINDFNAVCVAYIDSRDAQDLLDEVCGMEGWQSDYKEVKGNVYAGVGIKVNNEWVWKWDCGVESKTEAEKGEASDSFKRACVKWGVGRFLYALEIKKLKVAKYKDKNYPVTDAGDKIWNGEELTEYLNRKDKPVKTTLYNHQELGSDAKPLISNAQFKNLYERVQNGEHELIDKAKDKFSFAPDQLNKLNSINQTV